MMLAIAVISVFLICGIYCIQKFYDSVFRLSIDQVNSALINDSSQCKIISDCKLLPGDILIRRYITDRTWLINKIADPYFTHSAFYLGEDQIIEAVGKEKNRKDDIQIAQLSKSDWLNQDVESFVIIRPSNYGSKLEIIRNELAAIANDPDYKFGLPKKGQKKATCADLIFQQLLDQKILNAYDDAKIITPDYLFSASENAGFEIIGYNIRQ